MITIKNRFRYLTGKLKVWLRTSKPGIERNLKRARNVQKPFFEKIFAWGKQILIIIILFGFILYLLDRLYINALDTQSFTGILSLNLFTEVVGAFLTTILIALLQRYYTKMSNESQKLKEAVMKLRMDLFDWEFDLLSDAEKIDNNFFRAFKKWLWMQDETGWFEIKALIEAGEKIVDPKCKLMIEKELWRIKNNVDQLSSEKKEKLETLVLNSEKPKSIGEVLEEFDNGTIVEDEVYEVMFKNYFIKWAWKGDETGWVDLNYFALEKSNYLSTIIVMIELELGYLDEQRRQGNHVDRTKEKRLKDIYIRALM